jgi:hypothetical protein
MLRGGLLLYHFPNAFWFKNAATIMDHVGAFERYSRFGIQTLNTDFALPRAIAELDFQLVIVHYSVMGAGEYALSEDHLEWLRSSRGYKVLFAQDENRYCGHRFWFCDEAGFDTIYTLLELPEARRVYGERTGVPNLRTNLPGYVSEHMIDRGERFRLPDDQRPIDIGYRGRQIPAYSGRGGYEKQTIGRRFAELGAGSGLVLDIEVGEGDRLYGDDWFRFLGRCKGVLGVESGVSIFDIDDRVVSEYEERAARGEEATPETLSGAAELEGNIHYRTISPRHFEAAVVRNCQILFEGRYSGVMEPMVHYIPLRKDFSNFDEVVRLFRNGDVRRALTENAHRDLIASGRYTYEVLIRGFDEDMLAAGVEPAQPVDAAAIKRALRDRRWRREVRAQLRWAFHRYRSLIIGTLLRVSRRLRGWARSAFGVNRSRGAN